MIVFDFDGPPIFLPLPRIVALATGPAQPCRVAAMIVLLTYRCRNCGDLVTLDHESQAATPAAAIEGIICLRVIPGAGLIESHPCGDGIGVMDLMHARSAEPADTRISIVPAA